MSSDPVLLDDEVDRRNSSDAAPALSPAARPASVGRTQYIEEGYVLQGLTPIVE